MPRTYPAVRAGLRVLIRGEKVNYNKVRAQVNFLHSLIVADIYFDIGIYSGRFTHTTGFRD